MNSKMFIRVKKYLQKELPFKEDTRLEKLKWLPGNCKFGLCGEDAACIPGPNFTHKCVCPSDLSPPVTENKLCPTRKIVPLTPRPILNINISGGNISPSSNTSASIQEAETILNEKSELGSRGGFITGLVALIVFFVILVGAAFWIKKKIFFKCLLRTNRRKEETSPSPLSLSKRLLGNYVANPQYLGEDIIPVPILSKDSITFVQEIGEGCFGKVFKGELKKENGTFETVAVKVLKESASKQAEDDFMREVEIMSAFRHENILRLMGIVFKDSRPWMVFEYMMYGDLADVLRRNSKQFWKPLPGLKPLTKDSLLKIAIQIAGGMKYLASQRFVHNDLACRNCLVGTELTVKIADFGMSRDVYTCDYYRIGGSKPVPLRWMSPESVMYRRFTLESDIWSYGVVLWEIYTLGKQPYFGLSNEEVVKMILQGVLLSPPEGCPPFITDIMKACWRTEPKDRIRFQDIYLNLKKVRKEREAQQCPTESPSCVAQFTATSLEPSDPSLPRPPAFPVSPSEPPTNEILDSDNYLAPQAAQIHEYLETLPD